MYRIDIPHALTQRFDKEEQECDAYTYLNYYKTTAIGTHALFRVFLKP